MNPRVPDEINLLIYSLLNVKDLAHVSQVSKRNKTIAAKPTLWTNLARKDFCTQITDDPKNPAKNKYKEIKLEISREKDQFIKKLILTEIKTKKIEATDQLSKHKISTGNKGFFSTIVTVFKESRKLGKAIHKQNKENSNFKKTYEQLYNSETSLAECQGELLKYITVSELKEYQNKAENFYYNFISGKLNLNPCDVDKDEHNKIIFSNIKFEESDFTLGFSILCHFDAHLSLNLWIANSKDSLTGAFKTLIFKIACLYSSPKIQKQLVEQLNININEVSEVPGISCAPIFYVLFALTLPLNKDKKLSTFKETISYFLDKNVDLSTSYTFHNKSNHHVQSLGEFCKDLLNQIKNKKIPVQDIDSLVSILEMVLEKEQEQKIMMRSKAP